MMQRIADTTVGLDRYAWPLVAILSTLEPDFARFDEQSNAYDVRIKTGVYARDGAPNWAQLTMAFKPLGLQKVIAFGRDTYRDEIVVQVWEVHGDGLEEQPSTLHRFAPPDLMRVALFIRDELAQAYAAATTQA